MTVVHTIRLHAGWKVEPLPTGGIRYTRSFGQPRTLDANEKAWLLLKAGVPTSVICVNDQSLTLPADITHLLKPRNTIVVDLLVDGPREALELVMEIVSS